MPTATLLRVVIDTNVVFEGISLNQYIVYALTRQATLNYIVQTIPMEEVNQQKLTFQALLQELGQASVSEIQSVLNKREVVTPEAELNPEIIARFQQRLENISPT